MKCFDFNAVIWNDDIYCIPCIPDDTESDECIPIFADSEWDTPPTCCVCGEVHDYVTQIR